MTFRELTCTEINQVSGAGLNWCLHEDVKKFIAFGDELMDMAAKIDSSKDSYYVAATNPLLKNLFIAWWDYGGADGKGTADFVARTRAPK